MALSNPSFPRTRRLPVYLALSLLIHAGIASGLYLIPLRTPTGKPPQPISVEIIRQGGSPAFARAAPSISAPDPLRRDLKVKELTVSPKETMPVTPLTAVVTVAPTGTEPKIPSPAMTPRVAPVPKVSAATLAQPGQIRTLEALPVPKPSVNPRPPERSAPVIPDDSGSLVSTTVTPGPKDSGRFRRARPDTSGNLPDAEPFAAPPGIPAPSMPEIPDKGEMVFSRAVATSRQPHIKKARDTKGGVTSLATAIPRPLEKPAASLPILKPHTEPAAPHLEQLPVFPLPGSVQGAFYLLAIDTSGSVKGGPLQGIKKSAHDFINLMGPKDRAAIISFDDRVRVHGSFLADQDVLHRQIESLKAAGSLTVLNDALETALEMVREQAGANRYIVLFSDGKDEGSRSVLQRTLGALGHAAIPILAVGYSRVEQSYLDILQSMAGRTGGIFVPTPQFRDMISLYRSSRAGEAGASVPGSAKQAGLKLDSRPSDAKVFLNGQFRGKTPLDLLLSAGKYEIKIVKPAYYSWQAQISLKATDRKINVRLLPAPASHKD